MCQIYCNFCLYNSRFALLITQDAFEPSIYYSLERGGAWVIHHCLIILCLTFIVVEVQGSPGL